jgi:UDP-N-acetyl-D-mannosaminuronate dehydrogenase
MAEDKPVIAVSEEKMKGTIGVIGLGYVGLSLTAAFANVGHRS